MSYLLILVPAGLVAFAIWDAYMLGKSNGWLECHEKYARPALDGWKRQEDLTNDVFDHAATVRRHNAELLALLEDRAETS